MKEDGNKVSKNPFGRVLFGLGLLVALGIMSFFLWAEHKAHLLGVLPYLLLLLCPVMHFFMHKGHHQEHGHHGETDQEGKS